MALLRLARILLKCVFLYFCQVEHVIIALEVEPSTHLFTKTAVFLFILEPIALP